MKNPLLLSLTLLVAAGALAAPVWTVDPARTKLEFSVRHMMIADVTGSFHKLSGRVEGDPADPASAHVDITVDPASIDTGIQDRDTHLRTSDFFDIPRFPSAHFVSTRIARGADGKWTIVGNLTLRGVTKEVSLVVESLAAPTVDSKGVHMVINATSTIRRHEFGIEWNQTLDGGGVVVGDDVTLKISIALDRPK